jgi:hypothetical protein
VSIYRFIDEAEKKKKKKKKKASYRVSMCCVQGLLCAGSAVCRGS